MNGASSVQIFLVLLLGWVAVFVLGWQAGKFSTKTIECNNDECTQNKEGICSCSYVNFERISSGNMACNSFELKKARRFDKKA